MVIVWLFQALFGGAALLACGVTCRAVLRGDSRAHFYLTLAGSMALIFFISVPKLPVQMIGVALIAILAGILMTPPAVSFDSTATGKWRRR
jgi:hypothetical protein